MIKKLLAIAGFVPSADLRAAEDRIEVLTNDIAALTDDSAAIIINASDLVVQNNIIEGIGSIRVLSTAQRCTIVGNVFKSHDFIARSLDDALAASDDICPSLGLTEEEL